MIAKLFDERDDRGQGAHGDGHQSVQGSGQVRGDLRTRAPPIIPELALLAGGTGHRQPVSLNPDTVVETWMFLAGQSPEDGAAKGGRAQDAGET